MKRKKSTSLPRLTVLSMSRKELTSFVSAVEHMRNQVNELSDEVARLRDLVDRLTIARRRRPTAPANPVDTMTLPPTGGPSSED